MLNWNDAVEYGITDELIDECNGCRVRKGTVDPKLDFCRQVIYDCEQSGNPRNISRYLDKLGLSPKESAQKILRDYDTRYNVMYNDKELLPKFVEQGFPNMDEMPASNIKLTGPFLFYDTKVWGMDCKIDLNRLCGEVFITLGENEYDQPCGVAFDLYHSLLLDTCLYREKVYMSIEAYLNGEFILNGFRYWSN